VSYNLIHLNTNVEAIAIHSNIVTRAHSNIEQATSAIRDWYLVNGLLLNTQKSEVLVVGTCTQVQKFKIPVLVTVAGVALECKKVVTLLGVNIDSGLTMDKFVYSKISAINHHL